MSGSKKGGVAPCNTPFFVRLWLASAIDQGFDRQPNALLMASILRCSGALA